MIEHGDLAFELKNAAVDEGLAGEEGGEAPGLLTRFLELVTLQSDVDESGRDLFSRLIYGARNTIGIAFVGVSLVRGYLLRRLFEGIVGREPASDTSAHGKWARRAR